MARYSFKSACKHFGINPDDVDADKRLTQAMREVDGNKKKRGAPISWTLREAFILGLDAITLGADFKNERGREPTKKEIANILSYRYQKKASTLQTMLSSTRNRKYSPGLSLEEVLIIYADYIWNRENMDCPFPLGRHDEIWREIHKSSSWKEIHERLRREHGAKLCPDNVISLKRH